MQKKINGIILAAGRGRRLKNFNKPKSLIIKKNKYLIEHIIENFKQNKIYNITIVTGYKSNEIKKVLRKYKVKFIFNKKWKNTNMFYSLLQADKLLSKNFSIVSYADIFYKSSAIKMLNKDRNDISLTSFKNWKKLWQRRFSNPLSDLESFKVNTKNYIKEIGQKPKNYKDINGQYMGVFALTPIGWKKIKNLTFNCGLNLKKISLTEILNKIIKSNVKVKAVNYTNEFFEIDYKKDLKMITKNL